jgi:hypothetical protein
MSIQQAVTCEFILIGDGASTTFTYSFDKLFTFAVDDGLVINPSALPSSVTMTNVAGAIPTGGSASLDGFGNIVLTFPSAWSGQGTVYLTLEFNSGTLAGTTAAWTSATAVNTTWTLPLAGSTSVLVPFVVTGTVTAGTILFSASADGTNFFPVQGYLPTGFQTTSSWTPAIGNTAISFNLAGYAYLRLTLSVVIAGTGTVTFIMQGTSANSVNQVAAGIQGIYNSAAPIPAAGAASPVQVDAYGNIFVNEIRRSQVVPATGNIASATAATLLAAQGAGIFADMSSLVLTLREGATANIFFGVLVSDGTNSYRFNFLAQDVTTQPPSSPFQLSFNPPIPAHAANTAWTIALTSATDSPSVDYIAVFVKQQAE